MLILFIIYLVLGYWATGETLFKNKILIGTPGKVSEERLLFGALLGWILIPVAIIRKIFNI